MMGIEDGDLPGLNGQGCGGNQNERRNEKAEREKKLVAQSHNQQ